ncbi:MAG: hypothetical protein HKP37_01345 [Boseongicola sp.]|nr:hypothetical protein [Boseongicola sp.]NNL17363.1 hypothetical protein [Boseongicola sp.]
MKRALVFPLLVAANSTLAQDGLRESDMKLDMAALTALLSGQVVEFFDGSKSSYLNDSRYEYTYTDDGPIWAGAYRMEDNSAVCVDFDNGSARCDFFVKDGARVILITSDGLRFPVRNITVAKE